MQIIHKATYAAFGETMNKQENIAITKYDLLFEQRLTKVETTMDAVVQSLQEIKADMKGLRGEMRTEFRWLFGLMVLFSGSLLGVMAKGFHWY